MEESLAVSSTCPICGWVGPQEFGGVDAPNTSPAILFSKPTIRINASKEAETKHCVCRCDVRGQPGGRRRVAHPSP